MDAVFFSENCQANLFKKLQLFYLFIFILHAKYSKKSKREKYIQLVNIHSSVQMRFNVQKIVNLIHQINDDNFSVFAFIAQIAKKDIGQKRCQIQS